MKISGGSFETKTNDVSLRSMIDAHLLGSSAKEKFQTLTPQTHPSIFASLISSKLAVSHASIFNGLNSKSSEQLSADRGGTGSKNSQLNSGNKNLSPNYSKFSTPSAINQQPAFSKENSSAENIRNEFEKFKQLKKNSLNNYNKQVTLSNHLIAVTNKDQLQFSFANNTNLANSTPTATNVGEKRDRLSNRGSLARARKQTTNNDRVISYKANPYANLSASKDQDPDMKTSYRLSSGRDTRPVTVKLFASSEFKMNLPPINKLKLFRHPGESEENESDNQSGTTYYRSSLNRSATLSRANLSRARQSTTARARFNHSKISEPSMSTGKRTDEETAGVVLSWPHSEMPYNVAAADFIKRRQNAEGVKNGGASVGGEKRKHLSEVEVVLKKEALSLEYSKSDMSNANNTIEKTAEDEEDLAEYEDEEEKDYW